MSGQRRRKQQSEERFVLVPRNLRDPKLYDPEESNFVLVPESQVGSAAEHASYVAENRLKDNFTRPDAKATMAAAAAMAAGSDGRESKGRIELREVDEMGFKNDGYDYSQHLRPTGTGGGIFISATGKRGADPFHTYETPEEKQRQLRDALTDSEPARLLNKDGFMGIDNVTLNPEALPEEIKRGLESDDEDEYEPSERHTAMERALRARRAKEEAQAERAAQADQAAGADGVEGGAGDNASSHGGDDWVLAGEEVGGLELLQDDFIMQALKAEEEDEGEEGGAAAAGGGDAVEFDFEAHVARLMAEAEAEEATGGKVSLHRVGARFEHDDVDDGEEEEGMEAGAGGSQLPAGLNPNSTLAAMLAQYDDEHIGAGAAAAGFMGGDDGGGEGADFDGDFDGDADGDMEGGGDGEMDPAAAAALFGGGGDIGAVLAAMAEEELRAAAGGEEEDAAEEGAGDDEEEEVLVVGGADGGSAEIARLAAEAGLGHLGLGQTGPEAAERDEGDEQAVAGADDRSVRSVSVAPGQQPGATTDSAAMQEAMEVFLRTRGLDRSGKAVSGGEQSRLDDDGEGLGGFGRFKEDLEAAATRATPGAQGEEERKAGDVDRSEGAAAGGATSAAAAKEEEQAEGEQPSVEALLAADEAARKQAERRIDDMLRREQMADMDCQTVVSTYSTTDNLPTVLGEEGVRRRRRRRRQADAAAAAAEEAMPAVVEEEEEEEEDVLRSAGLVRSKAETKAEKKERKRLAKEAKRRAREAKRQTKEQFKAAKSTLTADAARQAASGSMAKRGQSVFRYS